MTYKVLFIDDDVRVLSAFKRQLRQHVDFFTAASGAEGLDLLKTEGPFAVVVSDQQMPLMDGVTFLGKVKDVDPLAVRIMLTGNADQQTAIHAVNDGAIFRFLTKPCKTETLLAAIKDAGKHYDLLTAEKDLLEHTLAGSIKVLVDLLSATQPGCFKEISRMRDWGRLLRNEIAGVNGWELDMAILLSQLGAVLLPPEVSVKWNAGEVLTDTEQTVIEQMPETARDLIMNIPRLEGVANAVYFQDKCFDGSGFPAGEPGGATISLTARILNILNGLASASKRGRPGTNAFEALQKAASRYDPSLLATIRGVFERADAIEEEVVLDLPVANMQSGDEVLTDVKSMEGKLLLAAGAILTDAMVKKMRQFHRLSRVEEPISVRRNERSQQAA